MSPVLPTEAFGAPLPAVIWSVVSILGSVTCNVPLDLVPDAVILFKIPKLVEFGVSSHIAPLTGDTVGALNRTC